AAAGAAGVAAAVTATATAGAGLGHDVARLGGRLLARGLGLVTVARGLGLVTVTRGRVVVVVSAVTAVAAIAVVVAERREADAVAVVVGADLVDLHDDTARGLRADLSSGRAREEGTRKGGHAHAQRQRAESRNDNPRTGPPLTGDACADSAHVRLP